MHAYAHTPRKDKERHKLTKLGPRFANCPKVTSGKLGRPWCIFVRQV